MDGFDDDSITLASAMTYNELGLVVNDYEGGYGYGDTVGTIDMNDQGVAMLEYNIFCTKEFAKNNPNTVKAFLAASAVADNYGIHRNTVNTKIKNIKSIFNIELTGEKKTELLLAFKIEKLLKKISE